MRQIIPIVEGPGEEQAVPLLLRRWFAHQQLWDHTTPGNAIVTNGCGALKCDYNPGRERGIEYYVRLAVAAAPDGILVILDSDDECLPEKAVADVEKLGPRLLARARNALRDWPAEVAVVVAHREFEAWFLASLPAYCDGKLLPSGAAMPPGFNYEALRDCKGHLSGFMGRKYSPPADQPSFAARLPFDRALETKVSSYGKFLRDLERLTGTRLVEPVPAPAIPATS